MKTTVAVLYGGRSGEHEVSLRSAESVIAALELRVPRMEHAGEAAIARDAAALKTSARERIAQLRAEA